MIGKLFINKGISVTTLQKESSNRNNGGLKHAMAGPCYNVFAAISLVTESRHSYNYSTISPIYSIAWGRYPYPSDGHLIWGHNGEVYYPDYYCR